MKRPAFQFYPGDWRSNANLRRCTHKERGIWIDVMCLLHDSEEYGILRWPLKELAEAVSCKPAELASLAAKGVLKGADAGQECEPFVYTPRHAGKDGDPATLVPAQVGPVWFSSRMVKDEYLRSKRGEGSRFGAEPKAAPDAAPKATIGARKGDGASSSSSSSSSRKDYGASAPEAWIPQDVWAAYCEHRRTKRAAIKTDETVRLIVADLADWRTKGVEPRTILEFAIKNGHTGLYYKFENPHGKTSGRNPSLADQSADAERQAEESFGPL